MRQADWDSVIKKANEDYELKRLRAVGEDNLDKLIRLSLDADKNTQQKLLDLENDIDSAYTERLKELGIFYDEDGKLFTLENSTVLQYKSSKYKPVRNAKKKASK